MPSSSPSCSSPRGGAQMKGLAHERPSPTNVSTRARDNHRTSTQPSHCTTNSLRNHLTAQPYFCTILSLHHTDHPYHLNSYFAQVGRRPTRDYREVQRAHMLNHIYICILTVQYSCTDLLPPCLVHRIFSQGKTAFGIVHHHILSSK